MVVVKSKLRGKCGYRHANKIVYTYARYDLQQEFAAWRYWYGAHGGALRAELGGHARGRLCGGERCECRLKTEVQRYLPQCGPTGAARIRGLQVDASCLPGRAGRDLRVDPARIACGTRDRCGRGWSRSAHGKADGNYGARGPATDFGTG